MRLLAAVAAALDLPLCPCNLEKHAAIFLLIIDTKNR